MSVYTAVVSYYIVSVYIPVLISISMRISVLYHNVSNVYIYVHMYEYTYVYIYVIYTM